MMRKVVGLIVGLSAVARLAAFATPAGRWADPTKVEERYGFTKRFEQGLWKDGNLATQTCVDFVRESLATGDTFYVTAVFQRMIDLVRRRQIDAQQFSAILEDLRSFQGDSSTMAHWFEVEIAIAGLSVRERAKLYKEAMETESEGSEPVFVNRVEVYFDWLDAARRALEEEMDDLVPVVESVLRRQRKKPNAHFSERTVERLERIYLPLAQARRSGDVTAGYLKVVEQALVIEPKGIYGDLDRDELVREVMLGLVRRGEHSAIDDLKVLWSSEYARLRKKIEEGPRRVGDRAPREWGVDGEGASLYLVAGIRALGDGKFEERLWKSWFPETPDQIRDRLRKEGVLKASPTR